MKNGIQVTSTPKWPVRSAVTYYKLPLLLRIWEAILRFVFCRVMKHHKWETLNTKMERLVTIEPAFQRWWVRERVRLCTHCCQSVVVTDYAPIGHDWQRPERLFDEKGPKYRPEGRVN